MVSRVKLFLAAAFVFVTTGIFMNDTFAKDVDMSVDLQTSATVVLSSSTIEYAINPTAEGSFGASSVLDAYVYSNSPAGMRFGIATESTSLVSDTYDFGTDSYPTIPTLSQEATVDTFEVNRWGVTFDGTHYYPMPESRGLLDTRNAEEKMANGVHVVMGVGAKLNLETVPGKYSTTINFIVVAEIPHYTLEEAYGLRHREKVTVGNNEYYTMQDMTPSICETADADTDMQAVDLRDNKIYWIMKGRDGKCWMSQNLDLELSTSVALTPDTSDVENSWTPSTSTIVTNTGTEIAGWSNEMNAPVSVDPGNWYFTDTWYESTECPSSDDNHHFACNYLSGDVIGNNSKLIKFAQTAFSNNGEHGHVGNYYNWTAAIAMNDSSSYSTPTYTDDDASGNPRSSICPRGWRLPITNASFSKDEFMRLAIAYGMQNTEPTNRDSVIVAAPFYAVRAGGIAWGGHLQEAGSVGGLISSSLLGYNEEWGYEHSGALDFASNAAGTNYGSTRYDAISIRCIAR